ncbi:uncharacterized protein LOC126823862 [Patella vulgata]|uniref:uncharacterized protein LOC126823862 n=1 Tax=Patella vulgata TaxID=6465 RepID=UPI00217F7340|nr:uncharacterized protein LOC126823862 [Patella vulgata]
MRLKRMIFCVIFLVIFIVIVGTFKFAYTFIQLLNHVDIHKIKVRPVLGRSFNTRTDDKKAVLRELTTDDYLNHTYIELKPIRIERLRVFVYSAVLQNSKSTEDNILDVRIQAIKHQYDDPVFQCCLRAGNGNLIASTAAQLFRLFQQGQFQSAVYSCRSNVTDLNIEFVSFKINCAASDNEERLQVLPSEVPKGDIAICVHAVYGYVDPELIAEWMEIMWLQGVRRIFVYPLKTIDHVDERTMKVFKFYEARGLVRLIPYELAVLGKDLGFRRFKANHRTYQMFSDEFVPIYDCQSRASNYKYTMVMDFDEIIVNPEQPLQLLPTLNHLLRQNPFAAYFTFHVENFVKNWGETNPGSDLVLMKYINRSRAMYDRPKAVYVKGRTADFTMHNSLPAKGFKRIMVPVSTATIHHYTSCRYRWSREFCLVQLSRFEDKSLLQIESLLTERMKNVPEDIRNPEV